MALLGWIMMGIAIWHFTVFLPDRFWAGIVGAFLGAVIGAVLFALRDPAASRCRRRTTRTSSRCSRPCPARSSASPSSYWIGVRQEARVGRPAHLSDEFVLARRS